MSVASLAAHVDGIATDPAETGALRDALTDGAALAAYADAKGHAVSLAEAEELLPVFRTALDAAAAQPLSDEMLDTVSGGRRQKPPSRKDIEIE